MELGHAQVAAASMADQARRLRNHPSVFVVALMAADNPPSRRRGENVLADFA